MALPFDIARCIGISRDTLCATCRRLEPGHEWRQIYIAPAWDKGQCRNYIEQKPKQSAAQAAQE